MQEQPCQAELQWRPSAKAATVRLRAQTLRQIRAFFDERDVLEVDTPLLGSATVTDVQIVSLETRYRSPAEPNARRVFLQTSPEFAMKRLLSAGYGPIYQVCKAFRDGEEGALHNPEFTILEWYRPGYDHHEMMDEVEDLIASVLGLRPSIRLSYRDAFRRWANVDPSRCSLEDLRSRASAFGLDAATAASADRDTCLDMLLTRALQPQMGELLVFIYDFPKTQAALARIRPGNPPVGERFELFVNGIELANGYHELTDAKEQRQRFRWDLAQRKQAGLPTVPIDRRFLRALQCGLPASAGVALGVDRLLMVAAGANALEDVIAFPIAHA